jgi:hypothetical protein
MYCEGKVKRTLKRGLKALEIVKRKPYATVGRRRGSGSDPSLPAGGRVERPSPEGKGGGSGLTPFGGASTWARPGGGGGGQGASGGFPLGDLQARPPTSGRTEELGRAPPRGGGRTRRRRQGGGGFRLREKRGPPFVSARGAGRRPYDAGEKVPSAVA